ncbi:MAG TPA: cyclase family protein, partial [Solirubrobacteraceae bacterium]
AEHGPIPEGAWVLFRSGWDARAHDEVAFLNAGPDGPQTPGPDVEASRWLAEHPSVVGFGVETVGIDAGAAGGMDPPFPLHNLLLGAAEATSSPSRPVIQWIGASKCVPTCSPISSTSQAQAGPRSS